MPSKDIVRLLREQDLRLRQTPVSLATQTRIVRQLREAVATRRPHDARWVRLLAVCVLAGLAVALAWGKLHRTAPVASPGGDVAATNSLGGPAPCTVHQDHEAVDFSGRCVVQLASVSVRTDAESKIRNTQEGVQVLRGSAWFEVAHVPAGAPPVRVRVGGGVIEVLGTKFSVDQNDRDGSVDLLEGRIRFVAMDGALVDIRPGERFRWTNASVPAAVNVPSTPVESAGTKAVDRTAARSASTSRPGSLPRSTASPPMDRHVPEVRGDAGPMVAIDGREAVRASAEAAASRVMQLRAEGRYGEAMTALAALHGANVDKHTAEVLSFEEGNILEHLEDRSAVCGHWRQHLARFPEGQYRLFVTEKLSHLGCR